MKDKLYKLLSKSGELLDILDIMQYALAGYAKENSNAECLNELMKIIKTKSYKLHKLIDETNIKAHQINLKSYP